MTTPVKKDAGLSLGTLNLLAELLAQVTLRPVADDFEEQAAKIGQARRELIAAIAEQPGSPEQGFVTPCL